MQLRWMTVLLFIPMVNTELLADDALDSKTDVVEVLEDKDITYIPMATTELIAGHARDSRTDVVEVPEGNFLVSAK